MSKTTWGNLAVGLFAIVVGVGAYYFLGMEGVVSVRPDRIDVGTRYAGDQFTERIVLLNRTRRAIKVVGASATCNCLAVSKLPVEIRAGDEATFYVEIHVPKSRISQGLRESVTFFVSDMGRDGIRQLPIEITGVVRLASARDARAGDQF